jgi:hypothetical protein
MRKFINLFILLLIACSCNNRPKDILPPSKMKAVLWDYIQADTFTTDYISKDSSKNPALENAGLQKTIFNFHHVTKEEFYKSYNYYLKHGNEMQVMLDSIVVQKNRDRQKNMKKLKTAVI